MHASDPRGGWALGILISEGDALGDPSSGSKKPAALQSTVTESNDNELNQRYNYQYTKNCMYIAGKYLTSLRRQSWTN